VNDIFLKISSLISYETDGSTMSHLGNPTLGRGKIKNAINDIISDVMTTSIK
jgi:hypothetical protein